MSRSDLPAIEGGVPVRARALPYARHEIVDDDIAAVVEVLRGDWLTTGPGIDTFERDVAAAVGAREVVAVSSGTAALHAALAAVEGIAGRDVIVPSLTFVATANAALYVGARPVFAEVDGSTLVLDPADVARKVTPRTAAVVPVDYAGSPCDVDELRAAVGPSVVVVEDAAHALGATRHGRPVAADADLTTLSFHPVKHITSAEGGAIATASDATAAAMRRFRNHGMATDVQTRERTGAWRTEMVSLGFNYRLTDVAAALGRSQLRRLPAMLAKRREIAAAYSRALRDVAQVDTQRVPHGYDHAWHFFPILVRLEELRVDRDRIVAALRAENIGATMHYPPVHAQPYYRTLGLGSDLPVTERVAARLLTLPLFPAMGQPEIDAVVDALTKVLRFYRR